MTFSSFNPSNTKKVSLGGKSKRNEGRDDVLKQARLERERRAIDRKREAAAVHIQKCWRRYAATVKAKTLHRLIFKDLYGQNWQSWRNWTDAQLDHAIWRLTFFFDAKQLHDVFWLQNLLNVLFQHRPDLPEYIKATMRLNPTHRIFRLMRLAKLLRSVLQTLQYLWAQKGSANLEARYKTAHVLKDFVALCAGLPLERADPKWIDIWSKNTMFWGLGPSPPNILGIFETFTQFNLKYGAHHILSEIICQLSEDTPLSRTEPRIDDANLGEIKEAVCNLLGSCLTVVQRFQPGWIKPNKVEYKTGDCITRILASTLCSVRVPQLRTWARLIIRQFSEEIKEERSLGVFLKKYIVDSDWGYPLQLLGNLLAFLQEIIHGKAHNREPSDRLSGATGISEAMKVITAILQVPYVRELFPREDDSDDLLPSAHLAKSRQQAPSQPPLSVEDQIIVSELQKFVAGDDIVKLLQTSVSSREIPVATSDITVRDKFGQVIFINANGESAWAFVKLIEQLEKTGGLKSILETTLATQPDIVNLLWFNYVKSCYQSGNGWFTPNEYLEPGYLSVLTLMCRCYSGFLSTSDRPITNESKPLPLEELYNRGRGFVAFVTTHLELVLWGEYRSSVPGATEIRDVFMEAAGRMMCQLNDRNLRKPFIHPAAFSSGLNNRLQFITEVRKELKKHEFLENTDARVWRVLTHAPFLIDFELRAIILHEIIHVDKQYKLRSHYESSRSFEMGRLHGEIGRKNIFWDGFKAFGKVNGSDLRQRFSISFTDEYGNPEMGIDGGGLFKDFMENIVKEASSQELGLFAVTPNNRLYPNPDALSTVENAVEVFNFFGKMLGKALYEELIVEFPLASFFLKQLLDHAVDFSDLETLDAEVYKHLTFLESYEGDFDDLALNFTIRKEVKGHQQEVELIPNGKEIPVTAKNVAEYVKRVADYKLNLQTRKFTNAMRHGLEHLIQPIWLRMFNAEEFQMLIAGKMEKGLDIADLQKNVEFGAGYSPEHPSIKLLWEVLTEFTPEQQNKWLRFVTSCSRPPLLGFKQLKPKLNIHLASSSGIDQSQKRLPSSSTCSNLLKLPPYENKEDMASTILYAIENMSGFDLS